MDAATALELVVKLARDHATTDEERAAADVVEDIAVNQFGDDGVDPDPADLLDPDDRNACGCGSRLYREAQYDGYGIFLTYTCPKCHVQKMRGFRSDIHERYECDEPIEPEEY